MSLNINRKFGFTLVEVMVVVIIIGIMSALAIPSMMREIRYQNIKAGGIQLVQFLEAGAMKAKATRQIHSILISSATPSQLTLYRGDSCGLDVSATGSSGSQVIYTDSVLTTLTLQNKVALFNSPTSTSPTASKLTLTTSKSMYGNWFSKSGNVCVRLVPTQVGNPTVNGGVIYSISGYNDKILALVAKSATDNRIQLWMYNASSWHRVR